MSHQDPHQFKDFHAFFDHEGFLTISTLLERIARGIEERQIDLIRRGMSLTQSAKYIGVSATSFEQLVRSGRMPAPIRFGNRRVWDVREIDDAFHRLPVVEHSNPWGE